MTTEDLESQRVQEIMGISEFGRKAKTFDITVRFYFALDRFHLIDLFSIDNICVERDSKSTWEMYK